MRPIPSEICQLYGIAERPWWASVVRGGLRFGARMADTCSRLDGLVVESCAEGWKFRFKQKEPTFYELSEAQAHVDAAEPMDMPSVRVGQIWVRAEKYSGSEKSIPESDVLTCASKEGGVRFSVFQIHELFVYGSAEREFSKAEGLWLIRDPWFPSLFWGSV